jgi:hypothetical protein
MTPHAKGEERKCILFTIKLQLQVAVQRLQVIEYRKQARRNLLSLHIPHQLRYRQAFKNNLMHCYMNPLFLNDLNFVIQATAI